MSVPRPTVPTPTPQQLAPALAGMGLPAPAAVSPMAPPWAHASFRLRFPRETGVADLMLRRVLHAPLRDSLATELAALTMLQHWEPLPVARTYHLLPPGPLPYRAALSQILPGTQGMGLIRQRPGRGPAIAATMGALMARLRSVRAARYGTVPVGGRFLARRGSWREEWAAHAWGALGLARSDGLHLGPLTDAVVGRLEAGLPALDGVSEFTLVHGDLHPSNLLFEPEAGDGVQLTGLVDWEGALCGDPLIEWAVALELPASTLGHVVEGYGRDEVAALVEQPEALARLEVYAWTRCLTRLGWATGGLFRGDGGRRRALALEVARQTHEAALEPDFVARKLRAALDLGTRGPVAVQAPSSAPTRALIRALEATHRPSPVQPDAAVTLSAALASALLAHDAPPPLDERWLATSEAATDRLGPQIGRQWAEPVPDRWAWAEALCAELCAGPARVAFALSALWLGLEAVGRLGSVSDEALRGLETLLRLRRSADQATVVSGERELLAHALLGLAATEGLAALGHTLDPAAITAWKAQLRLAWDDLVLFGSAGVAEAAPGWSGAAGALEGADLLLPALRLALERAPWLPAPRELIWASLSRGGDYKTGL